MAVRRVAGRRGGSGEFLADSASQPGTLYSVDVRVTPAGASARCPCVGFPFRGYCRHTEGALAALREESAARVPVHAPEDDAWLADFAATGRR